MATIVDSLTVDTGLCLVLRLLLKTSNSRHMDRSCIVAKTGDSLAIDTDRVLYCDQYYSFSSGLYKPESCIVANTVTSIASRRYTGRGFVHILSDTLL